MANPYRYFVELRNHCGTTWDTHVVAHSAFAATTLAMENNPGWRALSARRAC